MRGGAATLANLHTAQAAINKAIDSLSEGGAGNPDATVAAVQAETTDTTIPTTDTTAATATTTDTPQTGGKTKKSKSGKKRKLNGFMKFANTRRSDLMKANPGKAVSDIGKMLGGEWRALSDATKAGFNA
jgi:hypothetical protein